MNFVKIEDEYFNLDRIDAVGFSNFNGTPRMELIMSGSKWTVNMSRKTYDIYIKEIFQGIETT